MSRIKFRKESLKKGDVEYYVNLNEIKITPQFQESKPSKNKFARRQDFYEKYGYFYTPILISRDFTLIDGYISYLIAKKSKLEKVPVYFVGKEGKQNDY